MRRCSRPASRVIDVDVDGRDARRARRAARTGARASTRSPATTRRAARRRGASCVEATERARQARREQQRDDRAARRGLRRRARRHRVLGPRPALPARQRRAGRDQRPRRARSTSAAARRGARRARRPAVEACSREVARDRRARSSTARSTGEARAGAASSARATLFPVHGPRRRDRRRRPASSATSPPSTRPRPSARACSSDALTARAQAEAAQVRAEAARPRPRRARAPHRVPRAGGRAPRASSRATTSARCRRSRGSRCRTIADWCTFTLRRAARRAAHRRRRRRRPEREAARARARRPLPAAARRAEPAPARSLRTGEPQLIPEIADEMLDRDRARRRAPAAAARAAACARRSTVPLTARGRTIGALTLVSASPAARYGRGRRRRSPSRSPSAPRSRSRTRACYAERSHIAQTLQRSLLPPALPDIPGLELAARYRAAGDQNEVGGDFYDVVPRRATASGRSLIGDVSGKGAEAAALTSLTRHTLRAGVAARRATRARTSSCSTRRCGRSPTRRALLHRALRAGPPRRGRRREVTLATGGHLPPIVAARGRPRRARRSCAARSSAACATRRSASATSRLEPGDLLAALHRRRDRDPRRERRRDLGERGARGGAAPSTRGASAEEIVAAVEARAVELQGGEPRDDIALLALRARRRRLARRARRAHAADRREREPLPRDQRAARGRPAPRSPADGEPGRLRVRVRHGRLRAAPSSLTLDEYEPRPQRPAALRGPARATRSRDAEDVRRAHRPLRVVRKHRRDARRSSRRPTRAPSRRLALPAALDRQQLRRGRVVDLQRGVADAEALARAAPAARAGARGSRRRARRRRGRRRPGSPTSPPRRAGRGPRRRPGARRARVPIALRVDALPAPPRAGRARRRAAGASPRRP